MTICKRFDLNRVPGSCSCSEDSNEKAEEATYREEGKEVITKFRSTDQIKSNMEDPCSIPSVSLGIIKDIKSRLKSSGAENANLGVDVKACTKVAARKMSTIEIVQLARQRLMQPSSKKVDVLEFLGLTDEEIKDVELAQLLLVAAMKVGQQQFERARVLINQCDALSSKIGTSVQRLAHYFADALQEIIDKEAGGSRSLQNDSRIWKMFDMREALLSLDSSIIAHHLKNPLAQVITLTGAQIITEHVREARKVHIISCEVFLGIMHIVCLQDLATRAEQPLEHLKISVICTGSKSRIEATGRRLCSFAKSLNLSFTFKVVTIKDFLELETDLFELDDEEEVIFYVPFKLSKLNTQQAHLDSLIGVMKKINPCLTIIAEHEVNHTSPIFINRFMECLVHFSALFDLMADCMADDELNRVVIESLHYELWIRNVLAADGTEGANCYQCIDMWRKLFAGFGMAEIELSVASQDQAKIMLRSLEHGNSCMLDMDGKCLIVGWKGVPMFTVSAWKFT